MSGLPFKVQYTISQGEELHCLEDMRAATTGLGRAFRWSIVGFGLMWLIGGSIQLRAGKPGYGLFGIILGAVVLYANWFVPRRNKRRMKKSSIRPLSVTLEATEQALTTTLNDGEPQSKPWAALHRVRNGTYGVVLLYSNGDPIWIPNRVWEGGKEKKRFLRQVKRYKRFQSRRHGYNLQSGQLASNALERPITESDVRNREE